MDIYTDDVQSDYKKKQFFETARKKEDQRDHRNSAFH